MQDFLREISSSVDSLAIGRIPPYLTPLSLVNKVLAQSTGEVVSDLQDHLAYSLGGAIPLAVDPQRREIVFLLTLPVIDGRNIYRLKDVVNVGSWQGENADTYVRIFTPQVIAYHDSSPGLYLAPNLKLCTLVKEIHYLCPSKPFIQDSTNGICGLQSMPDQASCRADLFPRSQVTQTQAEILGDQWLIHTASISATVRYEVHDTTTTVFLPNQTFLVYIPENTLVQIDDLVLYHLPADVYASDIEMSDFFQKHKMVIDPATQQLILTGPQTIDLTALDQALKTVPLASDSVFTLVESTWSTPDSLLCALMILSYVAVSAVTFWAMKRFGNFQKATKSIVENQALISKDNRRKSTNLNTSDA